MDASKGRARARAEAAEWWLHIQPGTLGQLQREQFVTWLRESPVHIEEMLRVARVHGDLARFDRWDEISIDDAVEENVVDFPELPSGVVRGADQLSGTKAASPESSKRTPLGARTRWIGALAATVLIAVSAAVLGGYSFGGLAIETGRGERRELALADGSVVQVDPETRVKVKYSEGARDVVLSRGRALFRVAKDPDRPFSVHVEETVVRALGTTFAVERQSSGVQVTVAEGRVTVISPPAHDGGDPALPIPVLAANEQVTVKRSGESVAVRTVDTKRELAWTEGRLEFSDESLELAVEQFNRYNSLQLRIVDPALRARTVSGTFDASDPKSFAAFLEVTAGAQVSHSGRDEIAISSRH